MASVNRGGEWTKYYLRKQLEYRTERPAIKPRTQLRLARPYIESDIDFDGAAAWLPVIRLARNEFLAA